MILKLGSEGENVKKLQIKLGVDPIGKFGPKTDAAVKVFQSSNGLKADGIVGPTTWNILMGESVTTPPTVLTEPSSAPSVGGLKLEKLKGHIPDEVIAQIPDTASKFNINTPLRLAHFLAQCGHESAGFKLTTENLNYSAKGLVGIFKKYFPTEQLAESYQRQPQKIANRVYANRMSNGDENSGDGFKFRGRGYIQLTGSANYTAFGKAINEDIRNNPDLVSTKYPLLSAAWFWSTNNLNKIADGGSSDDVVTSVTKRVNGGTIGLSDRIKHFKEYFNLLS
jgi:putative chitinase